MCLSWFPLLHVYDGVDTLYQTHGLCPLELFRAMNPCHTNIRLGEFEAWWIRTVAAEGLTHRASLSVLLGKDGDCSELEEWSCWGLACGRG